MGRVAVRGWRASGLEGDGQVKSRPEAKAMQPALMSLDRAKIRRSCQRVAGRKNALRTTG